MTKGEKLGINAFIGWRAGWTSRGGAGYGSTGKMGGKEKRAGLTDDGENGNSV